MDIIIKSHQNNAGANRKKDSYDGAENGGEATSKLENYIRIAHFADLVAYDVSKFVVKNMEAVHPDTAKMMKKSKTHLVKK